MKRLKTVDPGDVVRFRRATPDEVKKRPEMDDTIYRISNRAANFADDVADYALEFFPIRVIVVKDRVSAA